MPREASRGDRRRASVAGSTSCYVRGAVERVEVDGVLAVAAGGVQRDQLVVLLRDDQAALAPGLELQLTHPRSVHDHAPAGQADQLPVRRGVAPLVIALPHTTHPQDLLPGQAVDQRGLAHAGGAEQRYRLAVPEVRVERVEPLAAHAADHVHGDAEGDALDLGPAARRVVG